MSWLTRKGKQLSDDQKTSVYGILGNPYTMHEDDRQLREQIGENEILLRDTQLLDPLELLRQVAAQNKEIDFAIMTLQGLLSHNFRTGNNKPIDIAILTLKAQRIFGRIEMNMSEELARNGMIEYLEMCEMHVINALNETVMGWKAELTKVSPKRFEFQWKQEGKKP